MNNPNMMDMMKSNLSRMLMFKSINNCEKSNNIYDMIYIFLITQIIEFIFKNLPFIVNKMKKYSEENLILRSNNVLENLLSENKRMNLTSSITIQINISEHENTFGQALLDFITNNKNTKHISFKKGKFILNQHDVIEIEEEILIKLKENKFLGGENDNKSDIEQEVELFSYTKSTHDLRDFLNKISHDYNIKIKNKLYDKLCIEKLVLLNKEKCSTTIQMTNIDSLKNSYAENEDNQYTLTKTNVKVKYLK